MLTVEIARSLYNLQIKKDGVGSVLLEAYPTEILEFARKKRGRPQKALRHLGRIDVAVFDKKMRPVAIVEVKRSLGAVVSDVQRIAEILNRCDRRSGGTLRHGCIAAIKIVDRKKTLDVIPNRINKQVQTIQSKIKNYSLKLARPIRNRHDF